MNIQPGDLESRGYVAIDVLEHAQLVLFIREYMKKRTAAALIYTFSNLAIGLFIIFWLVYNQKVKAYDWTDGLGFLSYGIALAFALIPLHEYLHVLAYRAQGAKHTSFDVQWKKFIFLAVADQFVANYKEFRMVALAPFLVISTLLILAFLFVSLPWTFTILGTLLTHTAFSSGDFGLLSYMEFHRKKDVLTFDDRLTKRSFFYVRVN